MINTSSIGGPTAAYGQRNAVGSVPQEGQGGESYAGTVASLEADAIYANNPALKSGNASKELGVLDIALGVMVGLAGYKCCCNGNNSNNNSNNNSSGNS